MSLEGLRQAEADGESWVMIELRGGGLVELRASEWQIVSRGYSGQGR